MNQINYNNVKAVKIHCLQLKKSNCRYAGESPHKSGGPISRSYGGEMGRPRFISQKILTRFICPFLLLFLMSYSLAWAATTSGLITNAETWSGTVRLTGDVTIGANGVLTILAGTTVTAPKGQDSTGGGADASRVEIILQGGTLTANGTTNNPILFTSAATNNAAPGDWYGLWIKSGNLTFQNVRQQYGSVGLRFSGGGVYSWTNCVFTKNSSVGVWIDNKGVYELATVQVVNNGSDGIYCNTDSSLRLVGVAVSNNTGWGLNFPYSSQITMSDSQVSGNTGGGINVGRLNLSNCTVADNGGPGISCGYGPNIVLGSQVLRNSDDGIYSYNGSFSVQNSTVNYNHGYGIRSRSSEGTTVLLNSTISFNWATGVGADRIVINGCNVINNGGAGAKGTTVDVSGSTLSNNQIGVEAAYLSLVNCTINGNNEQGVWMDYSGNDSPLRPGGITGNQIKGNGEGIESKWNNASGVLNLSGNDIYFNIDMDLKNSGTAAIASSGDYWGPTTTAELQSGVANLTKIYDKKDNSNVGAVVVTNFAIAPLNSTPVITSQPFSQTVTNGASVTFSVSASGINLTYQWQFKGVNIAGATNAALTLSNVTTNQAGSYVVQVSNTIGTTASSAATLTVVTTPVNTAPKHSADNSPADWSLSIAEVVAYAAAWKRGDKWPLEPNPIPISYLVRAGYLWKAGEKYKYDPTITNAPDWWVPDLAGPHALAATYQGTILQSVSARDNATVRTLPTQYTPAKPLAATIKVTPAHSVWAYAVEDQPPAGWTVSGISDGGAYDRVNGRVKWGLFTDNIARSFTYQVTPPAGASGSASFKGRTNFDGLVEIDISGQRQITLGPPGLKLTPQQLTVLPGQGVQMRLDVPVGVRVLVEASSDLVHWETVADQVSDSSLFTVQDSAASTSRSRFYRVKYLSP